MQMYEIMLTELLYELCKHTPTRKTHGTRRTYILYYTGLSTVIQPNSTGIRRNIYLNFFRKYIYDFL